jgi:hypothetical protein
MEKWSGQWAPWTVWLDFRGGDGRSFLEGGLWECLAGWGHRVAGQFRRDNIQLMKMFQHALCGPLRSRNAEMLIRNAH